MKRQLIASDEATERPCQHEKPCSDCPWSREALNGWLGGRPSEDWLRDAHGDGQVPCHVIANQQCAGLAIYRANVGKLPRDPDSLRLPSDREAVFANPGEFSAHHKRKVDR